MTSRTSSTRRRVVASGFFLAVAGGAVASSLGGCQQDTVEVPVRSLENSGAASYICLAAPNTEPTPLRPLSECTGIQTVDPSDYGADDAGVTTIPHLYGLVTQRTHGEIAVVDTQTTNGSVIDQDPVIPGANFLPVGAQPIGIVSTPGSTATFVATAEIGKEGVFVIPSTWIPRPLQGTGIPGTPSSPPRQLSSWPACALPSAPGAIQLVFDPAMGNATRATCDGVYGDSIGEARPNGDIEAEGSGRPKLVITLPDLGGFVVVDAQSILNRDPGSFDACPIDRFVALSTDVPPATTMPPPAPRVECVNPPTILPTLNATYDSRPSGIALSGTKLYLADYDAPLVHVVDLPTPCEPNELPPLLPSSIQDPTRVITTTRVGVGGGGAPAYKSYLYALDSLDGSAMIFDVSDDSTTRSPLQSKNPGLNPFTPPDRIRFPAPARDILLLERDVPALNPVTGVAADGIRCDPSVNIQDTCLSGSQSCDVGALYQTDATFDTGAGPLKLRGVFAFALLADGRLEVVDVDDYDAPCRLPQHRIAAEGCPPSFGIPGSTKFADNETSCNIVLPNKPRSGFYLLDDANAGNNMPGVAALPQLFDPLGAAIDVTDPTKPIMIAPLPGSDIEKDPNTPGTSPDYVISVAGTPQRLDTGSGLVSSSGGDLTSTLTMNLEDPRAQLVNQNWSVTFEGQIPGFLNDVAVVSLGDPTMTDGFFDPSGRFCDEGVESEATVEAILQGPKFNLSAEDAAKLAPSLSDYVQIDLDLPDITDDYWSTVTACTFDECNAKFGSASAPTTARDFLILHAFEDHVEVVSRDTGKAPDASLTKCCFSTTTGFAVRTGGQWIVTGDQTGFLHHVIPDPVTGECFDSCQAGTERLNGRVRVVPTRRPAKADPKGLAQGAPFLFTNPMFQFAIFQGSDPKQKLVRDEQFRFSTTGQFTPLTVNLSTDGVTLVEAQSLTFLPPTGEISVVDAASEGLVLVSTSGVAVGRTFF